jgi:hypothetical protein
VRVLGLAGWLNIVLRLLFSTLGGVNRRSSRRTLSGVHALSSYHRPCMSVKEIPGTHTPPDSASDDNMPMCERTPQVPSWKSSLVNNFTSTICLHRYR